jgi:hypothetical protein
VVGLPLAVLEGAIVPQVGEHAVPPCVSVQLIPACVKSLPTVAVNCWVRFTGNSPLPGVTEIVIAGTVTVWVFDAAVLNTEVAVMETNKSLTGGVVGAVKVVAAPLAVALGKTVPHGAAEHDTVQVTPLFVGSLVTVAVSWAVPPASTMSVLWVTETVVSAIVTVAEFDTELLATEAAVIKTVKSPPGNAAGAV